MKNVLYARTETLVRKVAYTSFKDSSGRAFLEHCVRVKLLLFSRGQRTVLLYASQKDTEIFQDVDVISVRSLPGRKHARKPVAYSP